MGFRVATMGSRAAEMGFRVATMGLRAAKMGFRVATMGFIRVATMGLRVATIGFSFFLHVGFGTPPTYAYQHMHAASSHLPLRLS